MIRLRIVEDESLSRGLADEKSAAADQLKMLVCNLAADPDCFVTVFVLNGSPSLKYWIIETENDGAYLGAITGTRVN